ncbi:unnamed protein product [Urochloa humidicola]
MSGASLCIKKDLNLKDVQLEILIGIINMIGGSDVRLWIGRRHTVLVATVFVSGSLLMGLAPGYTMLMAGQFVAGVGVGYAIVVAPVYTSEIAPAARGFLTSLFDAFINFGVLLGYLSNFAFARLPLCLGWHVMLNAGAAPAALLAILVLILPELPRWLAMQGRLSDAGVVLERTSGTPEEAAERLLASRRPLGSGIPSDLDVDGDVVSVPREQKNRDEMRAWKELVFAPSDRNAATSSPEAGARTTTTTSSSSTSALGESDESHALKDVIGRELGPRRERRARDKAEAGAAGEMGRRRGQARRATMAAAAGFEIPDGQRGARDMLDVMPEKDEREGSVVEKK